MSRRVMEFRLKVMVDSDHLDHPDTRKEVKAALRQVLEERVDPLRTEDASVHWAEIEEVE